MAPTINRSMTGTEWIMLVCLSILWGGSFFFTGIAIKELPPFTIVTVRVGLAAFILNVVARAIGLRLPRGGRAWVAFFLMGLLNNAIPFSLIVWGQIHIASGLASILNATTPLWTVVAANSFTTDEKMTGHHLFGVVVGFIGVVVMIGPEALAHLGVDVTAQLAILAAALSYAFAGIFGRRFIQMGIVPMLTATGQVSASTLMLIPVALVVDQPWHLAMPSLNAWAALIGIAALSTGLAYVLYFRILATAGATNLLLVTFLIPVSAIVLGYTILGERLDAKHLLGMTLIGVGLSAIDGRALNLLKRLEKVIPPAPEP
jgi:drug/metabolite transporter (DMT)-like permease